MAIIQTVQDGGWNDNATWSGGTPPTSSDVAEIEHLVTLPMTGTIEVKAINIDGGGLIIADSPSGYSTVPTLVLTAEAILYTRRLDDTMPLRLDGATLHISNCGVSCAGVDGFPWTIIVDQDHGAIIEDPGHFSQSALLQDIKPEGCGKAYARKIGNAVRFLTFNIRIPQDKIGLLGSLYRMAEGPFQVVATTPSCIIKGYIETVVPDPGSVGKEYITVKITIAEGPRE